MPYYVFKIQPGVTDLIKNMEKLDDFENFKQAKNFVKEKRSAQSEDDQSSYKIIFAENVLEAEERLHEQREAPILREWEK